MRPHPTDGYLCPGCTRTLAEQLLRMPALYRALARLPPARGPRRRSTAAMAPPPKRPWPVVEHVLD
ncbi:hypothetical protein MBT42_18415 [Streptomyces sp. MBT42]|uniref:hypothetical protein n=1 Tax=Streptomyces sp. MBT42 TaxID=1488373 RepID=UPI001E4109BA|nr:hypothetical protein [Streptomyces sp. MBT42]MCD2465531.1 hypothetical protein [Streptomyces sp. MBT42]